MFAHDGGSHRRRAMSVTAGLRSYPRWAKLSAQHRRDWSRWPRRAPAAGAEAVTLTNTLLGMVIDTDSRRPTSWAVAGGGLSGPAIHPIAVRAVWDVAAAPCPSCPSSASAACTDANSALSC
jgi:dihydroorotate dehydrogenase (NAD+) catalytic subunit